MCILLIIVMLILYCRLAKDSNGSYTLEEEESKPRNSARLTNQRGR